MLTLEACAQTGAVALFINAGVCRKKIAFFAGVEKKCRWKRQVRPGDTLIMDVELVSIRRGYWQRESARYCRWRNRYGS
ncbi:hypothetical protein GCM10020331_024330 [Ectobacillus funiculus]